MRMKMGDKMDANIEFAKGINSKVGIGTLWTTECYDKDGNLKWVEQDRPNVVTDEGINALLDIMFHGTSAKGTWYVAIFEADSTPATGWAYDTFANSDTTECQAYDEATRPAFTEAAASAKSMTNTSNKAAFTISDTKTIYGAALVSNSTKGDHTAGDYLFCASRFGSSRAVVDDDVLRVTVTISGADS
jgi:hypothetical protein